MLFGSMSVGLPKKFLSFDVMSQMPKQQSVSFEPVNEEIDLRELFQVAWKKRLLILLLTLAGTTISVIYSLIVPPVYESSVLLIPTETQKTDQLGAAAALLGGKKGGSGDLDLYQSLLTSRTVMQNLLKSYLRNESDTGKSKREPLFQILKVDTTRKIDVTFALEALSKSIDVEVLGTGTGGILQVTAHASTPWLAQQIADTVVNLGQEAIRKVRSERSSALIPHLELVSSKARQEWDATTQAIYRYRDRNRSIILPAQQLELDRLNMERQVMEQKYLMARKEVEQQLMDREKAAPPAIVLDPAELPSKKSKPRRTIIVLIGMFASLACSCAGVVFWKSIANT